MTESKSCLIPKLSYYVNLSQTDEGVLADLEKSEITFKAGETIHSDGDPMEYLYVVKSGWLVGDTILPDGGRHVVRIYHPGDIIGFPSLAFKHHSLNLYAANSVCLCPFKKEDLDLILIRAPRLTALLFTLSSREQVILMDTLRASSRMKATARIAFLLLEIFSRLQITNPKMRGSFDMPLTQADLGDAVGLTNVSVSRALSEMTEQNLIERHGSKLTILDSQQLSSICDFDNRHADLDSSWFPGQ